MKYILMFVSFMLTLTLLGKPTFIEIDTAIDEIAKKYEIPADILKAIAYRNTNWDALYSIDVKDNSEEKGRFGIMGLTAKGTLDSIETGSKLTGYEEFEAIGNYKVNIEMSAAILKHIENNYLEEGYFVKSIEDYFPILVDYFDFSPDLKYLSQELAFKIYRDMSNGYTIEDNTEKIKINGVDVNFSLIIFTEDKSNIIAPPDVNSPAVRWVAAHPNNYTVQNRTAADIDMVVIHQAEGSYEACISWFASANNDRHTSAHYCISRAGQITQMVKIKDKAHHAGNLNGRSIGIEHEGRSTSNLFTNAEYQASAMLVRWLAQTYTIPLDRDHIIRHHNNCPGRFWDWELYWRLLLGTSTSEGTVRFVQPQDGQTVGNPVTFKATVTGDVKTVKYYADDTYFLGESNNATTQFSATYRFSGVNRVRSVIAKGYDIDGNFISQATHTINFTPADGGEGTVEFIVPTNEGNSSNPVMMQTTVTGDVKLVKYTADNQYILGESTIAADNFKVERLFYQTGWRTLQAQGYNAEGILISDAFDEIRVNVLQAGTCQANCNEAGATRCSPIVDNVGDDLEICTSIDGCLMWTLKAICPQSETCNGTECVAPASGCRNDCLYDNGNSYKCEDKTRMHCEDYDSDGCYEWYAVETCGLSETCSPAACQNVPCSDECSESQTKCEGNEVKQCGSFDNDVCMDWGTKELCETGKTCRNGICVNSNVTCTNQCTMGNIRCQSHGVQSCKLDETTGCTIWAKEYDCKSDQVCSNGRCTGGNSIPHNGNNSGTTIDNGGNSGTINNGGANTNLNLGCIDSDAINLGTVSLPYTYNDSKDTNNATLRCFDDYPPNETNEAGPEYLYMFTLTEEAIFKASINNPEPSGTDIDLHLIKSLDATNPGLIERGHHNIEARLQPGKYYLSMDTWTSGSTEYKGAYSLKINIQPTTFSCSRNSATDLSGQQNGIVQLPFVYTDSKDTNNSNMHCFDSYPPNDLNEGGPEYLYVFTIDKEARFTAYIDSEPSGTDIDIHLIKSLDANNPGLIIRSDNNISAKLQPGTYYISMDTYVTDNGQMKGPYTLHVKLNEVIASNNYYFNEYILKAVDYINANYALLGYDINSVLTHDITYGNYGIIKQSGVNGKTMCVAAVMEVVLVAFNIYAQETGDTSVYDFLPKKSWERLGSNDIRGHIWVNHSYGSNGTGDALVNFGMGETIRFEELKPGSFINLNRTRTGHAVVFMAFLDKNGNEYDDYPTDGTQIIGFKYYSSQGSSSVGVGGFSYRYAIFRDYTGATYCSRNRGICDSNNIPKMPGPRDTDITYSTSQVYLNTGMMLHPSHWVAKRTNATTLSVEQLRAFEEKYPFAFDPKSFDGLTVDDDDYQTKSIEYNFFKIPNK